MRWRVMLGSALLGFVAHDATAYVCTPVPNVAVPVTTAWNQRCIPYFINMDSDQISVFEGRRLVAEAFRAWSMNPCTDLEIVDAGDTVRRAGFDFLHPADNQNVIMIARNRDELGSVSPNLLALTVTTYSRTTGELFDADIILNGFSFQFGDVTEVALCQAAPDPRTNDLRNTLTHEAGHFFGFDHSPDPTSTMFAVAQPCEIAKRMLNADDRLGLCEVYPAGQPVHTCTPPDTYDPDGAPVDPVPFRGQCARAVPGRDAGAADSGTTDEGTVDATDGDARPAARPDANADAMPSSLPSAPIMKQGCSCGVIHSTRSK